MGIPGKPYRPGSGTEGMYFDFAFCQHCARDAAYRAQWEAGEEGDPEIACQILADTFSYSISDPGYPKEWVYDSKGYPCCTAYIEDPNGK